MKKFVVLFMLLSITGVLSDYSADYGSYAAIGDRMLKLAEEHVDISYKYLMRSAYFGNYKENRDGFRKFFRELSDKAWNDAIELIKYNNKRGYHTKELTFGGLNLWDTKNDALSKEDTEAMVSALEVQKKLAVETMNIINHPDAQNDPIGNTHASTDPELVSYIEEHLLHQHADKIREIAGHVSDLKKMESDPDTRSLAITLFDDYLEAL